MPNGTTNDTAYDSFSTAQRPPSVDSQALLKFQFGLLQQGFLQLFSLNTGMDSTKSHGQCISNHVLDK